MDGKLWGINTLHVSFAKDKKASNQMEIALHQQQQLPPLSDPHPPTPFLPVPTPSSLSNPPLSTGGPTASASIFISGLAPETEVNEVKALFVRFGMFSVFCHRIMHMLYNSMSSELFSA